MNRRLSLVDISLPPLGYGCYGLSGAYGASLQEDEKIKVLQYAYDLGMRFFDTASSYDNTEEILGKAIGPFRKEVVLASKVGLFEGNRADLSKKHVISCCEESLKKLGTDYIDLYQVHFHDPYVPVSETVEVLQHLREQGKIRYIGVGHLPMDKTLEYLKLGCVSTVLAEINPICTARYKELIQLQEDYDFGIIAFSITGRGLLTGTIDAKTQFSENDIRRIDPLFKKSKMVSGQDIGAKLREIGLRFGKTPAQIAIAWTIQNPGVVSGLTGPVKLHHLKENIISFMAIMAFNFIISSGV